MDDLYYSGIVYPFAKFANQDEARTKGEECRHSLDGGIHIEKVCDKERKENCTQRDKECIGASLEKGCALQGDHYLIADGYRHVRFREPKVHVGL